MLSRGMSQGELLWNQCSPLSVLRPEEFKVDPQQWEALLSFSSSLPVGGLHLPPRSAGRRGPGRTPALLSSGTLWLDKRPAVTDTHQGLNHGLKGLYVEICSLGEMGRVPPGSKSPAAEHPSLLSLSSHDTAVNPFCLLDYLG